ncbi:zinc carboxypeptidase A [Daldinia decipiens]|uniref:zinc carboxypeptidase A n=1 Tax=Daldinia decipiens TaxID=326647 RepID=UPI0020C24280|nr:zinc carboxypeptidase A [Daldinia decipiens]KAI1654904.1 zinc carboxypeptidase A [Daldinia decipiens]
MKLTTAIWFTGALKAIVLANQDDSISFEGFKVYRIDTSDQIADLKSTFADLFIIELNYNRHRDSLATIDVAVPPEHVAVFDALDFNTTILSRNLGADIATEGSLGNYPELDDDGVPGLSWFDSYHAYEDHVRYWADLQASFVNNSELIQVGYSFEGRPIQGIHLWGSSGKNSKPAVFFNGNVHAREWITSIVVEYLLYQIVTGYNKKDTAIQAALDNYDFYVLPVVNPDGFVYSQTTNRLWRKNRQTRDNTTAVGTDINRNWSVGFGGDGSSSNPSSETFSGYQPGDAPETAALMEFAQTLAVDKGIKLYIDWHSYAQVILLSYGYICDSFPKNIDRQISLAGETAVRIAQPYNTTFDYGPGCLVLYQSSGNGRDYMTDAAGAEFGWGIELRSTSYGFVLPADQILPSSVEIWEGMKYLWANM